jgi:HSP20 family protein
MSTLLDHLSKELMREIGARSRDVYEMILPPVDMFEDGSDLVLVIDLPGFDKNQIKTRLSENSLHISAKRERMDRDGVTYWEQRPLNINKKIVLPVKVELQEGEELHAKYENGVLAVRLPIKGATRVLIE